MNNHAFQLHKSNLRAHFLCRDLDRNACHVDLLISCFQIWSSMINPHNCFFCHPIPPTHPHQVSFLTCVVVGHGIAASRALRPEPRASLHASLSEWKHMFSRKILQLLQVKSCPSFLLPGRSLRVIWCYRTAIHAFHRIFPNVLSVWRVQNLQGQFMQPVNEDHKMWSFCAHSDNRLATRLELCRGSNRTSQYLHKPR